MDVPLMTAGKNVATVQGVTITLSWRKYSAGWYACTNITRGDRFLLGSSRLLDEEELKKMANNLDNWLRDWINSPGIREYLKEYLEE